MMGVRDAVASDGLYANNLHLAPNKTTTPTPQHSIFTGRILFLAPNQRCQNTDGKDSHTVIPYLQHSKA